MKLWEFGCVMAAVAVAALLTLSPPWRREGEGAEPSAATVPAVLLVGKASLPPQADLERLSFAGESAHTDTSPGVAPSRRPEAPGARPVLLGVTLGGRATAYLSTSAGPAKARAGDVVDGWRLVQVRPTSVVLEREGQRHEVRLFSPTAR